MPKEEIIKRIDERRAETASEMGEDELKKIEWEVSALDLFIENVLDREVEPEEKKLISDAYGLIIKLQEEQGELYKKYK